MTIVIFLLDNSVSMNQRTIQGTTLLDVAKTATEIFFKIRMAKSRVDRYFVLTLDAEPNYVKLAGWKQNVDLQCIHVALSNVKADGKVPLCEGVLRAFRMLNLNRLQLGLENYGMGFLPSYIEPAVIIGLTDGCSTDISTIIQNTSFSSIESSILGHPLTCESFRWDYRLHLIVLQYPALIEPSSTRSDQPGKREVEMSYLPTLCDETGGKYTNVSDNRELYQCLDSLAPRCQPAVMIDFEYGESSVESLHYKQPICVKTMGRFCSTWPIPEDFWPSDEIVSSHLPPRRAHPRIVVSTPQVTQPNMPEYFPVDRYELDNSNFTQLLGKGDPQLVWQCRIPDLTLGPGAPFGFLKLSTDSKTVNLYLLPYNYQVFAQLLNELYDIHHMRMSESWGHQFVSYLGKIPKYYFMPLTKAFERFGFQNVIKPEAIDRVLPYQLKHTLQKLRHSAKMEFDNFVRMTQLEDNSSYSVKLPSSLLPVPLWVLREMKAVSKKNTARIRAQPYFHAVDIPRRNLRKALQNMRHTLTDLLSGNNGRNHKELYELPVAKMGDYVNYKCRDNQSSLREVNPSPERSDTFGNPFRKRTNSFVADDVFVNEMNLPNGVNVGANISILAPNRKKSSISSPALVTRTKGPLPKYVNHLNWRKLSMNTPPSSPIKNSESVDMDTGRIEKRPMSVALQDTVDSREAFLLNKAVISDLYNIIHQPNADGLIIFNRLNDLAGTVGQRYAAVSTVMSEALRFKRSSLYLLLEDWRSCIIQNGVACLYMASNSVRISSSMASDIHVNGWCS